MNKITLIYNKQKKRIGSLHRSYKRLESSDLTNSFYLNFEIDLKHVMIQVVSSLHVFFLVNLVQLVDHLISMISFLVNAFSIEQLALLKKKTIKRSIRNFQ